MENYRTTDLALSAFLEMQGFVPELEKSGMNKCTFIFNDSAELRAEIRAFWNNSAQCLAFYSVLRNLKKRIMNCK